MFHKALYTALGTTCLLSMTAIAQDLPIREDFNSLDALKANWDISTWGSTAHQYAAENVNVVDGILVLKLNASPQGVIPVGGEITYNARKFLYGSYRASIKTTNVPGSVIGWFTYKDGVPGDGQLHEVDFEILTRQPKRMWFTLHHDAYSVDHKTYDVSFDPAEAFHEYRFDWHKDSVVYYIDGVRIDKLTKKVPDDSTAIMFNHWSKNIANWGGAAPTVDTYMYVDYMEYQPLKPDTITPINTYQSPKVQRLSSGIHIQLQSQSNAKITVTDLKGAILAQHSIADQAQIRLATTQAVLLRIDEAGHTQTQLLAPLW